MIIQETEARANQMQVMTEEHRIGMRHLANMMGADPTTFTQDEANVGIFTAFNLHHTKGGGGGQTCEMLRF